MVRTILTGFFLVTVLGLQAQRDTSARNPVPPYSDTIAVWPDPPTPYPIIPQKTIKVFTAYQMGERLCGVIMGEGLLGLGSMIGLSSIWYKDYDRVAFHFFNDAGEWLQMDKAGHLTTAYTISKTGMGALKWCGVYGKKMVWIGGALGFVYQGELELLDGFSSGWGFSWSDMAVNAAGSLIAIGEELKWHQQRVDLKVSYHATYFPNYRPGTLGKNAGERMIKDYNGQTYWAAVNISSFLKPGSRFPAWLDAAFGYGATGMLGGHGNPSVNAAGEPLPSFERERQFFFSLDADLWRIRKLPRFLRIFTQAFGFIRIPLPALGFSREGARFYPLYF
jgi:hypothetical protein